MAGCLPCSTRCAVTIAETARVAATIGVGMLVWAIVSPADAEALVDRRIRFHVVTVEESATARTVVSEATVDGPPGTDFEIELNGTRFKMSARFLTAAPRDATIDVKARLQTRRLWGHSKRGLPLYEEDDQSHDIVVGLQERIVLLPFGRPSSGELLKIEITPSLHARPKGASADLEIEILRPSPDGTVNVRAFVVPHRFRVDAVLVDAGVEIARGTGTCEIEDSTQLVLHAAARSTANPIELAVAVERILRERPADLVAVGYRLGADSGSGVTPLGVPLEYRVADAGIEGLEEGHVLRITVYDVEHPP